MSNVGRGSLSEAEEGVDRICTWHFVVMKRFHSPKCKTNRIWHFASLG